MLLLLGNKIVIVPGTTAFEKGDFLMKKFYGSLFSIGLLMIVFSFSALVREANAQLCGGNYQECYFEVTSDSCNRNDCTYCGRGGQCCHKQAGWCIDRPQTFVIFDYCDDSCGGSSS